MFEEQEIFLEESKGNCIACGYHLSYPIYHPGNHPLSVLYLPKSAEEARNIPKYPMNFRSCASCGHIYNVEFDYKKIPYEDSSNLMFNKGSGWKVFMAEIISRLDKQYGLAGKKIIEIGCGDGHFLEKIREHTGNAECIGFEPGIEYKAVAAKGIQVFNDYFIAKRDLEKFRPDFLLCRHVIEHLQNPKDFVSEISHWAGIYNVFPVFFAEVPMINKAIKHGRINDYLYEHVSNFTDYSFKNMFRLSGYKVLNSQPGYGDEVITIEAQPVKNPRLQKIKASSEKYYQSIKEQKNHVHKTLENYRKSGQTIAFWGGTGKGASLLNGFELYADEYPVVVDSDPNKVGYYVPGTAQKIIPPEELISNPCDIIFICSQWRAKDIYSEIQQKKIPFKKVLVLLNKKIREYKGEDI